MIHLLTHFLVPLLSYHHQYEQEFFSLRSFCKDEKSDLSIHPVNNKIIKMFEIINCEIILEIEKKKNFCKSNK